ncbi:MAG: CatA-like O-acetyltransferase [Pyrinomonadaceae bacterium]
MYKEIDFDKWNRKEVFKFFDEFEDPSFNITANVNVSRLFRLCKREDISFSMALLFFSQKSVNQIREFKTRLLDGLPVEFDEVEATQTLLNDDESFSFCYFKSAETLREFIKAGVLARETYSRLKTFDVETERIDLCFYSVIPWVSFTSFKNAKRSIRKDTIPRIVFGKYFEAEIELLIPVSVEVNHLMMDGVHVGKYYRNLQTYLDAPEEYL